MQIHTFLDTAEADLAEIGGEVLAGSSFENEDPEFGGQDDLRHAPVLRMAKRFQLSRPGQTC